MVRFTVTAEGLAAADEIRRRRGHPERIERAVRTLLDPGPFSEEFPEAWTAWTIAMELVDADDAAATASAVGHHCRDAVTAFASQWCVLAGGSCGSPPDRHVDHIRAGLAALRPAIGDTTTEFLDALLAYWGTVIDLAMRQDHSGGPTYEDARVVAFQTGMVMFELDRVRRRTAT